MAVLLCGTPSIICALPALQRERKPLWVAKYQVLHEGAVTFETCLESPWLCRLREICVEGVSDAVPIEKEFCGARTRLDLNANG